MMDFDFVSSGIYHQMDMIGHQAVSKKTITLTIHGMKFICHNLGNLLLC